MVRLRNEILSFRKAGAEKRMTPATTTEQPRLGRPRSTEADQAIRAATVDLLATVGYANLTMSGVASRAGVSTATLYRRWRSKLDLVVDVLAVRAEESPVPDTGSLEGDCRALLQNLVEKARSTQITPLMAGLVGEIGRNAELAQALRTSLFAPRRAALAEVFARAQARRELREGVDTDLAGDLLFGPLYQRLLFTGTPVTPKIADELVDLVLLAIAAPRRSGRRPQ
jgi:AcrR family transcriptional regulator